MGVIKDLWQEQKQFILQNYSDKGIDFCAEHLGLSRVQTKKRAQYLGVKLKKHSYLDDFYPFTNKSAYSIGFIAGDGHVSSKENFVSIEINTVDAEDIDHSLMFTPWKKYHRHRGSWKPNTSFHIGSKELSEWLGEYGFYSKSLFTPSIVTDIPDKLLHYFLLGLFDADGCVQAKKIHRKRYGSVQISADKDFDWSLLKSVFEPRIGVSFKGTKTKHCSCIHLYNKGDIFRFYDYIYQNYHLDSIGLTRKYNKFAEID